jgi:hypothetical protein
VLAHDALEVQLRRHVQHDGWVSVGPVAREPDSAAMICGQLIEYLAAFAVRPPGDVFAVEFEYVEGVEACRGLSK